MHAAESFFEVVTKFGDSGFLLPASVCLLVALIAAGARRNAVVFACAWTACIGGISLAKLLFMACGEWISPALHSPSGHSALSSMFYLTLGLTAVNSQGRIQGRLIAALCVVLVALIAVSRVFLEAHSVAETLIGLAIGLGCFGAYAHHSERLSPISSRALLIGMAPLALIYFALGVSLHAEEPLERIAAWLARHLGC